MLMKDLPPVAQKFILHWGEMGTRWGVNRTFATFRRAEFGFFGVRVMTCVQTPRRNGQLVSAGDFDLIEAFLRPLRTS